jgi:hypothetical protein
MVIAGAARAPDEDWHTARDRYYAQMQRSATSATTDGGLTAEQSAVPYAQVDFSDVPAWSDTRLYPGFTWIRDPRWITNGPLQLRRETWLYPDDGCFARAALAGQRLAAEGYVRPFKIFVFGNLTVQTPNSVTGSVTWWFHTVPIIQVDGVPTVLDPAVEPSRSLSVDEWLARLTPDVSSISIAICDPYTYEPDRSCLGATTTDESSALTDQRAYFTPEAMRQVSLGRDPKVLGDYPPWTESHLDGQLQTVNCSQLTGWAWDGSVPSTAINVSIKQILIGGATTIAPDIPASQLRKDLLTLGLGNGAHGFTVPTPLRLKAGGTNVVGLFANGHQLGPSVGLTCPAGTLQGSLAQVTCGGASGWVADLSNPRDALSVTLYDNLKPLASVKALFSPDLRDPFSLSWSLGPGLHRIDAVITGTSVKLEGSPRTITCPDP